MLPIGPQGLALLTLRGGAMAILKVKISDGFCNTFSTEHSHLAMPKTYAFSRLTMFTS